MVENRPTATVITATAITDSSRVTPEREFLGQGVGFLKFT